MNIAKYLIYIILFKKNYIKKQKYKLKPKNKLKAKQ